MLEGPASRDLEPEIPPGLHYVDDRRPGYSRRLIGGKFEYFDTLGKRIKQAKTISRINALAIPPAYKNVWICPDPAGHIQATGRDARGRKQYRYNPLWCQVRDANKYERLLDFGQCLPAIRRRVERDLLRRDFGRERVVAAVVRLLDATLIRVGNQKYAKENRSYGLTTLRMRHTRLVGNDIRFQFRGKSGVDHDVRINDARVARVVRRCLEIPGQELFQWIDAEGARHPIGSADVNAYLKDIVGEDFTAKDYRTWAGSVAAFDRLRRLSAISPARPKVIVQVVKDVAKRLANTPAVCRKCYVHPLVVERFLEDALPFLPTPSSPRLLRADERRFFAFLKEQSSPRSSSPMRLPRVAGS